MAADGSGAKDTINVTVKTPVTEVEIKDLSGLNILAAGKKLKPSLVFNDGKTIPDNRGVAWSISNIEAENSTQEKYVTISTKDGTIYLDSKWNTRGNVTIKATSLEDESIFGELEVELYPITKYIQPRTFYNLFTHKYIVSNVLIIYLGEPYNIFSNIDAPNNGLNNYNFEINPNNAYNRYKYTSSNNSIVSVNSNGYLYPRSVGTATLTVQTMDGSNKKTTFTVNVKTSPKELKIKETLGKNVIYPGKTIKYELDEKADNSRYLYVDLYKIDEKDEPLYKSENEYLITSGNVIKGKDSLKDIDSMKMQEIEVYIWDSYMQDWYTVETIPLEMYPKATSSVCLDGGNAVILNLNERYEISAYSSPYNACQKYYAYSSSNPKVATVDSKGVVKAISNGSAKITVKAGDGSGKSTTLNITVSQKANEVIVSSKTGGNIVTPNKTLQLQAKVDSAAVNKNVIWSLENPADSQYGNISNKGLFKASAAVASLSEPKQINVVATAADGGGAADTFDVWVVPTISGFTNSEIPSMNKKDEKVLFIVTTIGNKLGDAFDINVKSSKTSVATVDYEASPLEGDETEKQFKIIVTGVGAGNTDITVTANDGSGVSTKYKLGFTVPVTSIDVASKSGLYALTPGKYIQAVANVNKDATNKGVEWSIDGDGARYVTLDNKGKITLPRTVGSEINGTTVRVTATTKDSIDEEEPTTSYMDVALYSSASAKVELGADNNEKLCIGSNIGELSSTKTFSVSIYDKNGREGEEEGVTGDFIVKSSKPDIVAVSVTDEKMVQVVSTGKAGKSIVTVMAEDGSSSKSIDVTTVKPVRKLSISSKTGVYKAASGTNLGMFATANSDATNKSVVWSVDNPSIADINNKGVVTIKNVDEEQDLIITASAVDGSQTTASRVIHVYPKVTGVSVSAYDSGQNLKEDNTIIAGDNMILTFSGTAAGYTVTYTTGAARVYYYTDEEFFNNESLDKHTTSVRIYGYKKGTCTVTAVANDGSGQKASYKVIIK